MNNFIRPFVRLARSEGDQRGSCWRDPGWVSLRSCYRISMIRPVHSQAADMALV